MLESAGMARIYLERRELTGAFATSVASSSEQCGAAPLECTPPIDVVETADGPSKIRDGPARRRPRQVQIVFARGTLLIAGQKLPAACEHADAGLSSSPSARSAASPAPSGSRRRSTPAAPTPRWAGELRIVLPRIEERRGAQIRIPIAP